MSDTILSKFQKLGKRNKPLYKKANAFVSGLNQVLKVIFRPTHPFRHKVLTNLQPLTSGPSLK